MAVLSFCMDDWRSALVRTLVTGAAGDVGSGGVDGDADGGVADVSSAPRGASAAGGLVRAGVSASSLEEGEQLPFEQPFRNPNMKAETCDGPPRMWKTGRVGDACGGNGVGEKSLLSPGRVFSPTTC